MEFAYKAKSFLVLLPFKLEALAVGTKFHSEIWEKTSPQQTSLAEMEPTGSSDH